MPSALKFGLAQRGWLVALVLVIGLPTANVLAQTGRVRGRVLDNTGNPLNGATVFIPEMRLGALTDPEGVFSIGGLAPGAYTLLGYFLEMDTLEVPFTVAANQIVSLDLKLRPTLTTATITIEAGNLEPSINSRQPAPGLTTVTAENIRLIPSFGTSDLLQYMSVLPGVVSTGDQGGQVYIRGGTPVQNLVLMDGAIIYNPFHSLGLFSVFDTDYIRRVDVYSGGYSAEYGGRVSSVMDIRTRNGNFGRFSGKVEATPILSGAMLEGPLGKPRQGRDLAGSSFLLSARNCYLNQTSRSLYGYVNDTLGLPFSFTDLYGKVTFGSGLSNLSLFGFFQTDRVEYGTPTNFSWRNYGGGTTFSVLPSNTNMVLSGNFSISNFKNQQVNPGESIPRTSSLGGFTGRLDFAYIINTVDEVAYGFNLLGFNTNLKFANTLGIQTEITNNNAELAGYVRYRKVFRVKRGTAEGFETYFNRAVLEPSVRVHFFNDHGITLEPRLRGKLNFKGVSVQAATGLYNQNLMAAVSDRDVVQLFQGYTAAVREGMANRPLSGTYLQRAAHYLGGVEVQPIRGLKFTVEGWFKDFIQVTNINRNRLFPEEDRFVAETGYAYGSDFIAEYQRGKLYLYGTYGYAINRRDDRVQAYFPVWDRRHNANIVANFRTGELRGATSGQMRDSKWEFGFRFNLGSGFPFTQTQGFFPQVGFYPGGAGTDYISQNPNLGVLLSSDFNGGRLPAYHRLDLMFKRRWLFGEHNLLEVSASVLNAYNRLNIFYYDRVRNTRVDQLPVLPTLGVVFRF